MTFVGRYPSQENIVALAEFVQPSNGRAGGFGLYFTTVYGHYGSLAVAVNYYVLALCPCVQENFCRLADGICFCLEYS